MNNWIKLKRFDNNNNNNNSFSLNEECRYWKLLYKSSIDGWDPGVFHQKCDKQGKFSKKLNLNQ